MNPPAPLALLKAALLELLEIDTIHLELDEQCPYILYGLVHLFFQGKLYLSYCPKTGHLGWSPTPEATAERNELRNEECARHITEVNNLSSGRRTHGNPEKANIG